MRNVGRLSRRRVQQGPRHPEVDQENTPALEPNNQLLAAPLKRRDALAGELGRHLGRVLRSCQPRVRDLDVREPPPDENRLETSPDRLDLGQLRHPSTLAMACYAAGADESTSSTIERACGATSPTSYAACTARTPATASSPRLRWQTTPTAWSIASSFVRRPAPRRRAARPMSTAPTRVTYPPR